MDEAVRMLRIVLTQEQRRGYSDSTVSGGLDVMLRSLHREGKMTPGSKLHDMLIERVAYPYKNLTPAMRERWVAQALTELAKPERVLRPVAEEPPRPSGLHIGVIEPPSRIRKVKPGTKKTAATAPTMPPRVTALPRDPEAEPAPPPKRAASAAKQTGPLDLDSPVERLPNAGRVVQRLNALGITTVRDLLYHLPHRYDDFSRIGKINMLRPGEEVTVVADVFSCREIRLGPTRRATELLASDGTGMLRVVWFNQPYLVKQLTQGKRIVLSGKTSVFRGQIQMDAPEWEPLEEGSDLTASVQAGRLAPVYPLTQGLTQRSVRRLIRIALDRCLTAVEETLPADVLQRHDLPRLRHAIEQVHFPDSHSQAERARQRLAFDEVLSLQLAVLRRRAERRGSVAAPSLPFAPETLNAFTAALPFPLTGAQQRVIAQTLEDLAQPVGMARLIQGDVGSGKTVVATAALLAAVLNGHQGSLMAPTEILAEQHFRTLCKLLGGETLDGATAICHPPFLDRPVHIALLRGGLGAKAKARAHAAISTGAVDIAVGTHALLQEDVRIPRLALAVVDEQHRFGVLQRSALRDKGGAAHLLVMTATPIPRTLALTHYGDLDVSVIDEMPPGRKPIKTTVVASGERNGAYNFIWEQIRQGRQAFVICPLVEESEVLEAKAATVEYERLKEEVFPQLSLALLHGRMTAAQKDEVMAAFRDGLYDILVSTAVVEVGIDIPNANIIMIEGAERFGLAQLHQFRGRVGRGDAQSYCLLLSDSGSAEARERLHLMEQHADGFRLAEEDLRLRGPGEYFGTRQSGMPELRIARITDTALIEAARADAAIILDADAALDAPEHAGLAAAVRRLYARPGDIN